MMGVNGAELPPPYPAAAGPSRPIPRALGKSGRFFLPPAAAWSYKAGVVSRERGAPTPPARPICPARPCLSNLHHRDAAPREHMRCAVPLTPAVRTFRDAELSL